MSHAVASGRGDSALSDTSTDRPDKLPDKLPAGLFRRVIAYYRPYWHLLASDLLAVGLLAALVERNLLRIRSN